MRCAPVCRFGAGWIDGCAARWVRLISHCSFKHSDKIAYIMPIFSWPLKNAPSCPHSSRTISNAQHKGFAGNILYQFVLTSPSWCIAGNRQVAATGAGAARLRYASKAASLQTASVNDSRCSATRPNLSAVNALKANWFARDTGICSAMRQRRRNGKQTTR